MKSHIRSVNLFAVEHVRIDGGLTFEVFRTLIEAKNYVYNRENWDSENVPLKIFSADFNSDNIYDDGGTLNYDDTADLWQGNYMLIYQIGRIPDDFERD